MKFFKSQHFNRSVGLLSMLLSACISQPTYSQDLTPSQLYYYEGNQRIELKIQEGVLAEFGANPTAAARPEKSTIKNVDKNASLMKNKGSINLWKTTASGGSVGISKSLNNDGEGKYSPVFQGPQGTNLALPGNIIVELDPSMTDRQAEAFFGSKGLRIYKKLVLVGRNFYEVETPAGSASLNLANSLYGQQNVISSSPNWWREVSAK
jgi:hypothetical protein